MHKVTQKVLLALALGFVVSNLYWRDEAREYVTVRKRGFPWIYQGNVVLHDTEPKHISIQNNNITPELAKEIAIIDATVSETIAAGDEVRPYRKIQYVRLAGNVGVAVSVMLLAALAMRWRLGKRSA